MPPSSIGTSGLGPQAWHRLAPEHRAVLVELWVHGASVAQAALALGISADQVLSRSHDALHTLKLAAQIPPL